jgi:hypothetical protein
MFEVFFYNGKSARDCLVRCFYSKRLLLCSVTDVLAARNYLTVLLLTCTNFSRNAFTSTRRVNEKRESRIFKSMVNLL